MRVFITGASGWIGSAVVPELIAAGHEVVGLARSDASARALTAAGIEPAAGDLDDLDVLRHVAAGSDGVIHLAFKHEWMRTGDFEGAAAADRRAVEAFGEALAGSGRPLIIASGTPGAAPGKLGTEEDGHDLDALPPHLPAGLRMRLATAEFALSLASRGVRSSVLRLPPTVHGDGDLGFMATIVQIARRTGVSGYVGDGNSRWPAVHRLDAARLCGLAFDGASAGSTLHAVADEGVRIRDIADAIGRGLGVPVASVAPEEAAEHFGFLAGFLSSDRPASSARTRQLLHWRPSHPGLIDDLDAGHYFREADAMAS
jgi:nucleoside-diphosphate-sugar epimerase